MSRPAESDGTMTPSVRASRWLRLLAWIARQQHQRPFTVLAIGLCSVVVAGALAMRLKVKTSFGEMLPEHKESVIVAERISERLPAMSTLSIVAEGADDAGLQRFVDALVPELRALGPELVGRVDDGVREAQAFYQKYRFLYAPLAIVHEIHDAVVERYEHEVAREAGTLLDDEAPAPITEATIRDRIEKGKTKTEQARAKYPNGYYLDPATHTIVVLVRTPVSSGDLESSRALQDRVRAIVDRIDPKRFDPAARIGLSGNLITSAEEYEQITGDLAHIGAWGVGMILGVVFLFYLRIRTLLAMALAVGIGAMWTFGAAYLLIGHLNQSSGLLFSIVVGNGINFGIIYMARYLEARRDSAVVHSLMTAYRQTWLGTLSAAGAAMTAYGSLAITDFRGFKHFGIIGGLGMILCWLSTYLFLPAILSASERLRPVAAHGPLERWRANYGRPFAWLATSAPRTVLAVGLGLTALSAALCWRYLAQDPMEYDLTNIRNSPEIRPSEARRLVTVVDDIVPRADVGGVPLALDRIDQVLPLKAELERRRDAAPAAAKPFDEVITIFDFLPKDQDEKIRLVGETVERLERARAKGFVGDADWKKIEELLPVEPLRPIGIQDLPAEIARPFEERDGTRGRLVYMVQARGRSVWDARYLIQWAEAFRTTVLPDGSVVKGSGNTAIFADLILAVMEDAPKTLGLSLGLTLVILLVAFRGRAPALWVVGSLVAGMVWMLAVLAVWKSSWPWSPEGLRIEALKLNFLNFVALPITVGVGADYAVNVVQRLEHMRDRDVRRVIVETGGAVVLCSLTTTLGYLALTLSVNLAIRSFGVAAAVGEICCLLTAVLLLPAALTIVERRKAAAAERDAEKT